MQAENLVEARNELSLKYCQGSGVEIGPGLLPTQVAPGVQLAFVDKRSRDELKSYFGVSEITAAQRLADYDTGSFDFLMAHHVLEHCSNVLRTLEEWMSYLKPTGTLFLSIPNRKLCADEPRLVATPQHFLHDYILGVDDSSFESREHIYSFLSGWHNEGGLRDTTKVQTQSLVRRAVHKSTNDLHWHVFTFQTFKYVIEVAAALAGRSVEFLHQFDAEEKLGEHRIVAVLKAGLGQSEDMRVLSNLRQELPQRLASISLSFLDGMPAYMLDDQNSGKGFIIDKRKMRWVREPDVYRALGLHEREPIYVELGSAASDVLGRDFISPSRPWSGGRAEAVLGRIPLDGNGLEISPGAAPLVTKDKRKITYCDKFGSEDWSKSYPEAKRHEVDVVLGQKKLDEVFSWGQFDYIVSSHVIEHIPDFIQFFISASKILKPNGVIVSLLPDRRYTFDALRRNSSVRDIELAHRERLTVPSDAMIGDFYRNCDMNASAEGLWNGTYQPQRTFGPQEATHQLKVADRQTLDMHCFTFTPPSFEILINHVIESYTPDLSLIEILDTPRGANEFLFHIRKYEK